MVLQSVAVRQLSSLQWTVAGARTSILNFSEKNCPAFLVEPPSGESGHCLACLVPGYWLRWHVEDLSFVDRPDEFDVLRVGPNQRHSRPCGSAVVEASLRDVFCVPDLFRDQSSGASLGFNDMQEPLGLFDVSQSEFIVRSFAC